jgi:nitrogen-specific signal transduction histidine kinase
VPALQIRVQDSGPGIAPSQRPHLFEPFHSSKPDGLGFGLSIARSLVEAHGGQIHLDNGWRRRRSPRPAATSGVLTDVRPVRHRPCGGR